MKLLGLEVELPVLIEYDYFPGAPESIEPPEPSEPPDVDVWTVQVTKEGVLDNDEPKLLDITSALPESFYSKLEQTLVTIEATIEASDHDK